MSLSSSIREQLLNSFRAELVEHHQTITNGLLALEQGQVSGEARQSLLEEIFRAAHSLKGAARAVGATMIEQLAHAMESVLDGLRREAQTISPALFSACYQGLDAIQRVQAAYESGITTPPSDSLKALADLEAVSRLPQAAPAVEAAAMALPAEPATSVLEADATGAAVPQAGSPAPGEPGEDDAANGMQILQLADIPSPNPNPKDGLPRGSRPAALNPTVVPAAAPARASAMAPAPNGAGRDADETIRVSVSKLDALMAQLSELLVAKLHAEQRLAQVNELRDQFALWQKDWLLARPSYQRLLRRGDGNYLSPTDAAYSGAAYQQRGFAGEVMISKLHLDQDTQKLVKYSSASQERLRDLSGFVNGLVREFSNDTMQLVLVIDELEAEIKRVRMLPLRTIVDPLRRMVRDLAQAANKEVIFQVIGGETELDKHVLEQIKDPLIHLLRNAVDHGLESRAERLAAGKPPSGTITLSAETTGQDVTIHIADDGAGIDLNAVRRVIARHSEVNADSLNETELVQAIFNAGVSTSPIITDISGRGVVLDVVLRNVEALQGEVKVDWKAGQGTTFSLVIPLTLTSSHGLLVRVAGELFAIPFNAIEGIHFISPAQVYSLEGHDTAYLAGQPTTVVPLANVLELKQAQKTFQGERIPVVVLSAAGRRIAFAVDELAGEQEVVIKNLGRQLARVGGVAGATVLGDGRVVLILNPGDLIKLTMRGKRHSVFDSFVQAEAASSAKAQHRILVVDDSITTRTLEKNILEAAGYAIETAIDGQEAWERILANRPDLIVSDIAMPRLNGFDLTRRIKEDPQTSQMPVILVTSLDTPEEKTRGIEAGADAYIIKSRFDQNMLLETIQQLI